MASVCDGVVLRIFAFLAFLNPSYEQLPPGNPQLSGPSSVVVGNSVTLTCSTRGGDPTPSVVWYRSTNKAQPVDQTATTSNGVTTNDYTFVANNSDHHAVFECQVDNSILENALVATWFFDVYTEPTQPTLTGPGVLIFGSTEQWTCTSSGGRPAPIVTLRIGNSQFSSGITQSSVLQSDNTYTIRNVLSWTPSVSHSGQTLYCDVRHQETRGNNLQTASLQLTVYAEPNQPTITGPSTLILGSTNQWTCISTRGFPAPTMTMRIGNMQFSAGLNQTSILQLDNTYTVTSVLSWAPDIINHGQTIYCDVWHQETRGNNLQTIGVQLTINAEPRAPTLTGPNNVIFGSVNQWTCISTGGRPAPTVIMRIENTQFTSGLTQTVVIQSDNTFTVTSLLSWSPTVSNHGQTLYCEVRHPETRGSNIQTASLQITVNAKPNLPSLIGPTTVIFGSVKQWTCVSTGGNPPPTMTLWIGNAQFSSGINETSLQQPDKTFTVTSVLTWAPATINHEQILHCDIKHQETLGNNLQIASLNLTVNAEPREPHLVGPSFVTLGSTQQWTCTSTGGIPAPIVTFRVGNVQLNNGITQTSVQQSDKSFTITSVLSWAPSIFNNGQVVFCDVQHQQTRGNILQTASLDLTVNAEPKQPTLTGPTIVIFGNTYQWTCISIGGYPPPNITLRVGNTQLYNGITESSLIEADGTYTVTSFLSWAPRAINDGQTLYCEVKHQETRGDNLQRASLQLTVYAEPHQPLLTGPSTVIAGVNYKWGCICTGGRPAPTMIMRVENVIFTSAVSQTNILQSDDTYNITSILSWIPTVGNIGNTLYCEILHAETLGNNSKNARIQLTVNVEPNPPLLTGPSTVIFESTRQWICRSSGGYPAAVMSFRIGNTQFSSGVSRTSVLESNSTYTITGILTWTPNVTNTGQTLYCDVYHQETLGDNLQTVGLQLTLYVEPNTPTLEGPIIATFGTTNKWTCSSTGGNPAPIITLRIGNSSFTDGINQTTALQFDKTYTVTTVLSWAPRIDDNGKFLYCDVHHQQTLGSIPQTVSLQLTVNGQPNQPTLTGPTTVLLGSTYQWTCFSTGGNPAPQMTLRIGNTPFTSGLTISSALQPDNTYTIITVLTWAPTLANSGQMMFCEVRHPETIGNFIQTDRLLLIVYAEPNTPVLTGPTSVIYGLAYQWNCTSSGGRPAPLVTLSIGDQQFNSNITQTTDLQSDNSYTVTSVLVWSPKIVDDGQTLRCNVQHQQTLGNGNKTSDLLLTVNAEPRQPTLTGPTTIIFGSVGMWTCISSGGKPAPVTTMRIGNIQFNESLSHTVVIDSDQTFTVTSVLSWKPSSSSDGEILHCDVYHPETLGNTSQTARLQLTVNVEPDQPTLEGPSTVIQGSVNQWTCLSTGGRPAPKITMRIEGTIFNNSVTQTTVLHPNGTYTVTSLLSWIPIITNHHQTLYCDVQHQETRQNNLQIASLELTVYAEPSTPVLMGPNTVTLGTTNQWTCISAGGNPAPTMTLRIANNLFTSNIIKTSTLQSDNSYTVTTVLSWAPALNNYGQALYCDVRHQETRGNNLQTIGLQLTLHVTPSQPSLTGPTVVSEGVPSRWTCMSIGGRPIPVLTWRIQDNQINSGVTKFSILQPDNTYRVTSVLQWTPSITFNGQTLNCDVSHQQTLGNNIQTASIQLSVNDHLSISGLQMSFEQFTGSDVILPCNITGTATEVTWYFNNQQITVSGSTKYSNGDVVNPSLTISDVVMGDAGSYYCQATNGVTTVTSRIITLNLKDFVDPAVGSSVDNESALGTGEIAAIILSILFLVLVILLIVSCCCADYCAVLCGRQKEKVTPGPDDTPTLDIPRFYEKAGFINEDQQYIIARKHKKRHKKYRKPSKEYEINKYIHMTPADSQKLESSHITITNQNTGNTGAQANGIKNSFTDGKERRQKRHKKKKHRIHHSHDQSLENEIVVTENSIDFLYPTIRPYRSDQDVMWINQHAGYDSVT